jgi:hypothetical protein
MQAPSQAPVRGTGAAERRQEDHPEPVHGEGLAGGRARRGGGSAAARIACRRPRMPAAGHAGATPAAPAATWRSSGPTTLAAPAHPPTYPAPPCRPWWPRRRSPRSTASRLWRLSTCSRRCWSSPTAWLAACCPRRAATPRACWSAPTPTSASSRASRTPASRCARAGGGPAAPAGRPPGALPVAAAAALPPPVGPPPRGRAAALLCWRTALHRPLLAAAAASPPPPPTLPPALAPGAGPQPGGPGQPRDGGAGADGRPVCVGGAPGAGHGGRRALRRGHPARRGPDQGQAAGGDQGRARQQQGASMRLRRLG